MYAVPIQMKKNRPGIILTVLTTEAKRRELEAILFRETATFGIRRTTAERSVLPREVVQVETAWGPVNVKIGRWHEGKIITPEFEDCACVAEAHGVPLRTVYDAVRKLVG